MTNFGQESSIHGVKYIFSSSNHKILRAFWSLALITSFCGFSYYISLAYIKWQIVSFSTNFYFHFKIHFQIPDVVTVSRERISDEFSAPAITICPNLFAREDKSNTFRALKIEREKLSSNYSEEECAVLTANLHWCIRNSEWLVQAVCSEFNYEKVEIVETITRTSLTVKLKCFWVD